MNGSGAIPGGSRRVRWGWVAGRVAPWAAGVLAWAAASMVLPLMSLVPQPRGRYLAEWFLRDLLVGYAAALSSALVGVVVLAWVVLSGRRRGVRRPLAARLWLACASSLIALAGVEAASATWLAWEHRLPDLPTRFNEPNRAGETSIVVIGGSSARGYPYQPRVSVGQVVAWQLERAMPGRRFVADVRAALGVTLETMHKDLTRLTRRPDVMIIYSGHNEITARYESTRRIDLREASANPVLNRLYYVSLASPFCRLVYESVSKYRLGGRPSPLYRHQVIDPPAFTPSEYDRIVRDFHRRLEAIVGYCERIGCLPVLVIPPGNERDFEPNRSVLSATASEAERTRTARAVIKWRGVKADDPARALAGYRAILARHPEFAEAHFRAARLLERAGDYDAANREYILARNCDGYPARCPSPFQEAYRAVARRHGCILVDGPAVLRRICPHGIVDDHAMNDAHHPALVGHVTLARAVLEALHARRALGWPDSPPPDVDLAETAAHFGVDAAAWEQAFALSANSYRSFALLHYDPSEEQAKIERLAKAALQVARGVRPETIGIPGFGISTDPPRSGPEPGPRRQDEEIRAGG